MATFKYTIISHGYGNPVSSPLKIASNGYGEPYSGNPEPALASGILDYYLSLMNFVSGVFNE